VKLSVFSSAKEAIPCAHCVRPEALLAAQNRALELIAAAAPLAEILDFVARFIEAQAPDLRCSILLVEGAALRLAAAPTLPEAYRAAASLVPIAPDTGCCGSAAHSGQPVIAADLASDPRWTRSPALLRLALDAGLRSCWSTPIRGADGAVLGTFAVYRNAPGMPRPDDVQLVEIATHLASVAVERDRAHRALEERTRRLLEQDQRKDEFLALLAHELRNPLAPVVTALDLSRLRGDPGELARYAPVIERQVRQLVRLVDDLLDVSRITRGKITLQRERTTVAAVLSSAIDAARPLLDRRGHALAVLLPDEPLELDADPVRLAQVLANLLNNAAKYTGAGGHVTLSAARTGGEIEIQVRDDGIGIPADMLGRVFDPFVQTDAAREQAQGGLGIGLTLVQRLVQLHGGRVEAESDGPGRGSVFTVRLPAPRDDAPVRAPETRSSAPPPPRRVLVVDDNVDAAQSLADALRDAGHVVWVENDGLSALACADAFQPDVALIDIGMPGIDGYEVARRLRATHPRTSLRLVALTGYGQEGDVRSARSAGFDVHLVKPADLERIAAALAG
jgi:signal transduction histidine kinase/CheY-like chemotaxis protein